MTTTTHHATSRATDAVTALRNAQEALAAVAGTALTAGARIDLDSAASFLASAEDAITDAADTFIRGGQ